MNYSRAHFFGFDIMGVNERDYRVLRNINRDFCKDAKAFRWQSVNGFFTNERPTKGDKWRLSDKWGWLRSVECKDPHTFMFCMDIDSDYLGPVILRSIKTLKRTIERMYGITPVMKASGKAGAHVYFRITFPRNYTPKYCLKMMTDISYTIYRRSGLKRSGILFGPYRKKSVSREHPGFIDSRMYDMGRMLRAFSIHPEAGRYSVPIYDEDSMGDVERRMRTLEGIRFVTVPTIHYKRNWKLREYQEEEIFERSPLLFDPKELEKVVTKKRGDRYWKLLPETLKGICAMEGDVHHDLKVVVVHHLAFYYLMEADEIKEWLTANVKWSDFEPGSEETDMQCKDAVLRIEKYKYPDYYIPSEPEHIPLRKEYYDRGKDNLV